MKTKYRLTGLMAVGVLFAALATGILIHSRKDAGFTLDLYFLNDTGTSIVTETRKFDFSAPSGLLPKIMAQLEKGPADSKNTRSVPEGAKWSASMDGSELLIDFSDDFAGEDKMKNMLSAYAVIKTLCQIDGVAAVKVTAGGRDIITPDNTALGYLAGRDINLESDSHTSENKMIKLYFADADGNLCAEHRNVRLSDSVPIEQYVVSELIKGPKHDTLSAVVSSDTKLISAEITDSTAYINMDRSFVEKNQGSREKELLAVYSIVNSVCDASGVEDVVLLIDGKKEGGFKYIDLRGILHRRGDLVKSPL